MIMIKWIYSIYDDDDDIDFNDNNNIYDDDYIYL